MTEKLVTWPHLELISTLDGATAVKQDASFVLDCQQVCLIFGTRKIDIPVCDDEMCNLLKALERRAECLTWQKSAQ